MSGVLFVGASLGDQPGSSVVQTAAFLAFAGAALLGWEHRRVLAAAWLAHAGCDLLHLVDVLASGTPAWYQVGRLVADPLVAADLLAAVRPGSPVP